MEESIKEQIRKDQLDEIDSSGFKNLDGLEQKRFRQAQISLLKEFLLAKKLEGCSINTIKSYHDTIKNMIDWVCIIGKDIRDLTPKDIRGYLSIYQEKEMSVFTP